MNNLKNTITNICGILIVLSGAIVTAVQAGSLEFLPSWVSPLMTLIGVVCGGLVAWATGKPANLGGK